MNRPLGLWILLSAGILWLYTQNVHGARATSLIFGKSSTTSTTTSRTTTSSEDKTEEEPDTTETDGEASGNSTKPVLTGIPQIDYIWDPNLPKELNGYNLSDYPFYERVPANITFKCDGLHDGFYASVLHKCQVYHHCLSGTRFDFLCANYTAFDQKTFICHFASEVDCNNSKRFWHRNDALYQAASTTTSKPLVIHTTPPPPLQPAGGAPAVAPPVPGLGQRRVVGRPYRRRRPYYEYYDDYYDDFYYDDRPRSRGRKRPRPRPRPLYDDDYEDDYEDDRYERRGGGGRRNENRRPSNRRPNRGRNKDRPRYDYDDDDEEVDKYEEDSSRRKPLDSNKKSHSKTRPTDNISKEKKEQKEPKPSPKTETKTIIKPVSGTIYDRPRVAPKIKPPVPKNEANKYAYKPISTTATTYKSPEYEDSYEEVTPKKNESTSRKKQTIQANKSTESSESLSYKNKKKPTEDYYYDYDDDEEFYSNSKDTMKEKDIRKMSTTSTSTTSTTTTTTTTTSTTPPPIEITEPLPQLDQPVIIRLVKRPFLPSRGGNPYSSRGLQPVGTRALMHVPEISTEPKFETDFRPVGPVLESRNRDNREDYSMDSTKKYVQKDYEERRVPQAPKPQYKNPLDNVEDYDVTLNDALNPTLPNLPVRGYPTGFDVQSEFAYNNNYQRNRFPSDQTVAPTNSDYVLKSKPQRYENPQSSRGSIREQPVQSNANYRGGYYSVIEDNYRPRQIQNTQLYYTRY